MEVISKVCKSLTSPKCHDTEEPHSSDDKQALLLWQHVGDLDVSQVDKCVSAGRA